MRAKHPRPIAYCVKHGMEMSIKQLGKRGCQNEEKQWNNGECQHLRIYGRKYEVAKDTRIKCKMCGELISKCASSGGMCFGCGDKAIAQWPKLQELENLVKECLTFADAYGVAYHFFADGRTLADVYNEMRQVMKQLTEGAID